MEIQIDEGGWAKHEWTEPVNGSKSKCKSERQSKSKSKRAKQRSEIEQSEIEQSESEQSESETGRGWAKHDCAEPVEKECNGDGGEDSVPVKGGTY